MRLGVVLALLTWASLAWAEPPTAGAIWAERPLPDGAVSGFVTLGYPGFSAGWRQGFGGAELGAVAGFSYTTTELTLDVPLRLAIDQGPHHVLGAGVRVGGFLDLGATWFEGTNRDSSGLRLAGELSYTYLIGSTADLFFDAELPVELPLTERGNDLYGIRMGGGGELGVGDGYSVGAQLLAGPQLLHPRGGQTAARLDLSFQVGLGRRF